MGRSYIYECPKCGYKAKVSGRADDGLHFAVQTVLCRDCRELHDAVVRLRLPKDPVTELQDALRLSRSLAARKARLDGNAPPRFEFALNRLRYAGIRCFTWVDYRLCCPVSRYHRVQAWNEPDKCPRCGLYLERSALPFRLWE